MEFYHEFRRLWDRAVPVQRGLGHIVIQADPEAGSRTPDLLFWQLGEHGAPDRRLAALSIAFRSNPDAVAADQALLALARDAWLSDRRERGGGAGRARECLRLKE